MSTERFAAIVVGSGQAGKPLARALAAAGHETAIVEKGRIGGTCVVEGCTPTKTMVASARVAHLARRARDYGVEVGEVSVDLGRVRDRKRDVVDSFVRSSRKGIVEQDGLTLLEGTARFVDERTLEVVGSNGAGGRRITAARVFLNVGARPSVPPVDGLSDVPFLDSTSIMELDELPRRLAVLGGGPVGVEFAQMFARFGSEVVVVEREARLFGREDDDVSDAMRDVLERSGVRVITGTEVAGVEGSDGGVRLRLDGGDGTDEVVASHLLVAVGRTPNSDTLDLDRGGIATDDRGFIPVDERCRTEADGVWAMGDVTGAPPFTHIAYDDYRVVAADVLGDRPARTRERMLPWVVYTDPELGRVGLTEAGAREQGLSYRVAKLPMTSVARAIETDETEGFLKCLVEDGTDRILGAAMLCVHGGEIMSVVQLAMMGDLPYTAITNTPIAHPTLAESLQNLFATLESD